MPATAPIIATTDLEMASGPAVTQPRPEIPDRVHRLEGEIAELRDTIARFAELVIGEVKDLRQSHAETSTPPFPSTGEFSATAIPGDHARAPLGPLEQPTAHRPWLLMELLRDLATTTRMYLDPRYRVRRATQILVPLIVLFFAFNCVFFNYVFSVPILSTALERLVDIVLAILLYKVISREAVRYRHVIAQLMAWQQHRVKNAAIVISGEPAMTRLETE